MDKSEADRDWHRIGVYGGTFDPIHYGHLRTALEVKEVLQLDQLRLVPSCRPPHRDSPAANAGQRLQMLRLAIAEEPGLLADARELERSGPSYMVDTLQSLHDEIEGCSLLLIIGSDAFRTLNGWYQWQQLFDLAHVLVMHRPGEVIYEAELSPFFRQCFCADREVLKKRRFGCLSFQAVTQLSISASQIRRILLEKRNPRFLLPDAVLHYIRTERLYSA